ncbi:MAG TPA: N-acetyltransferase [Terriglobales bacterium]|nr:N-acetyltransferase [Terriglobales bacterium]
MGQGSPTEHGVNLRHACPDDDAAIRNLIYAAFQNHPHHAPGALQSEHLLVDQLRADGALTLSLVAERNGAVVGHLAVSPVQISDGSKNWFGLGPVAVAPRHQRRGIGSALVRYGLEMLRQEKAAGLVVLGEPRFYQRFGFRADASLVLPKIPAIYFMALPLNGSLAVGTVGYHPAFG